jgi:hypothetical protein
MNNPEIKSPKEGDSIDLLELVCQLHSRALAYPSEDMHNAYIEARNELEKRLANPLHNAVEVKSDDDKAAENNETPFINDRESKDKFYDLENKFKKI